MKLKSKSFKLMERTDALLKMLALSKGVTETEIIEDALEQFAEQFTDKSVLNFINGVYGKKVDRDTVRTDRKRNSKDKKIENNVVILEEKDIARPEKETINDEKVEDNVVKPRQDNKEVVIKDSENDEAALEKEIAITKVDEPEEEIKNNNNKNKVSLSELEFEDDGYVSVRDAMLKAKKENESLDDNDKKSKKILTLDTIPEEAMDVF